jgi:hypothetical protein
VCQRQNPSVFGGESPYLRKGEWQLVGQFRRAVSDLHYQGREPFPELDPFGPINTQNLFVADISYGVTRRFSVSLTVPLMSNTFDVNRVPPGGTAREWIGTGARGLGDVSVRGNYWLFRARDGARWNLALSLGVKTPTGKAGVTDDYFGRQVPVDISIQPGDKAWAPMAGLQGFRQFDWMTVFGSANYMFNPRGTTGVPTFFGSLANPNNRAMNSSHDQFVHQAGVSLRAPKHWPTPLIGYRVSGAPVLDVFGSSSGFRRPGTIGMFEPGVSYTVKGHTFTVSVPVMTYVNIKDSPFTARIEDATVPKYMLQITWFKRWRP